MGLKQLTHRYRSESSPSSDITVPERLLSERSLQGSGEQMRRQLQMIVLSPSETQWKTLFLVLISTLEKLTAQSMSISGYSQLQAQSSHKNCRLLDELNAGSEETRELCERSLSCSKGP